MGKHIWKINVPVRRGDDCGNHAARYAGALIFLAFLVKLFCSIKNILFGIFTGVINSYYICGCGKDTMRLGCTHCTSANKWPRDVERSSPWPKYSPHFFLLHFIREECGQGFDSSVLHTNGSGQWRMEVASDASAWLVAITTTLLRVITFVSTQNHSKTKFGRVEGGGSVAIRKSHWCRKCCLCYQ